MAALKVLAVAVTSGRAGYVYLQDSEVLDWGITVRAVRTAADLASFVQTVINELKPEVVVTEKCAATCKKGRKTRSLIQAIAELASHNYVLDVTVPRLRQHPSKYEEAAELVKRHPVLIGYLPARRRRIYEYEPRSMILFEALALAEQAMAGPPEKLAAAMG